MLDLLKAHYYLGPFSIAAVAAVTAAIAILSYISTIGWNFARYLADRYFEIFRLGFTQPNCLDPSKTRKYAERWPLGHALRPAYEAYARLCWSHAWDIYSAKFLVFFFRRKFIRQYANTFETYKRLHGRWLENNRTMFPSGRFHRFIDKCKWRDYFDPRTADLLRWNNEVEDFEERVLHPLRIGPRGLLLQHIEGLPGLAQQTVADVGCGNGAFICELAKHPFATIYAVDYSDNMLELARKRCASLANVQFKKLNMLDMTELHGRCDVVFSLNSVLPRDPRDTPPILRQFAQVLKPGGKFIAVLPSFDTVLDLKRIELPMFVGSRERHLSQILQGPAILTSTLSRILGRIDRWKVFHRDKHLSGWIDNTLGRFAVCRIIALKVFGVILGPQLYADDGVNIQRIIHGDEIEDLLKHAGLVMRKKEKYEYPWELSTQFDYGHFSAAMYLDARAALIYDWFVVADKPS